jgi:hypothetical protein
VAADLAPEVAAIDVQHDGGVAARVLDAVGGSLGEASRARDEAVNVVVMSGRTVDR